METEFVTLMGQTFIAERYCVLCIETEDRAIRAMTKEGKGQLEVIAVVKEVTKKHIVPKNGGMEFDLYEIEAGDHVWTTKKQDIALSAHALVGQAALINGKVQQKGNYTNYYIDSIAESDSLPTKIPMDMVESNNGSTSRDESIYRQVATKVAAQLADNTNDFWQNVNILLHFYRTGEQPGQGTSDEMVAAQTYAGDDDIPF